MAPNQSPESSPAKKDDVRRIEQQLRELLIRLEHVEREYKTQFTRLAQLQAEVDVMHARGTPSSDLADRNPAHRRSSSE